ncbi:MAG: endonuclease MutS2 [Ignavibacteriae bacterium HGW-Ignavibacteriae-3]|nr:MAG: endonuclease MutS2 [Ignavibacteriae bacterium HGW-Ignavibacteriae-3]
MITKDVLEKLEYHKVIAQIVKYCITENGKNTVTNLLPLTGLELINKNGRQVNEAKEIIIKNNFPPIDYIPDLNETLSRSRIEGTILQSKQIIDILRLAETSRKLYQFLKPKDGKSNSMNELTEMLFVDKVFEHFIGKVFGENGEIRDDASAKLREIRTDIREKEALLRKQVQKLLKKLSDSYLVQEEYITQRDGRIVLPVKAEHKRHVRGFVHSESSTGQTVYIEPEETLELNNEILSLGFAEKREIEKILKGLTERIGQVYSELKSSLSAIAIVDSIFARAKYSIEIIGAHPEFDQSKPFKLLDARHPLLIKRIGRSNTVPMDLKLDTANIVLITGPNAGGKTVTLKTTGLLVCLALAGIPIPASPDSNLNLFRKVLVDIGDEQSIEDDLSTFSSHLTNIRQIIEEADEETLIVLDEIGTGTDPAEGAAIAAGMLITLRDKGAKVLATTHHGSLKLVANQLEKFQNASMEFDTDHLRPTYKFNQGTPGSSYAFEVANRIGFDEKFIALAKQYLDTDKTKIEDFLVSLEKKSRHLKEQLNNMERENTRLKGLANLYHDKISRLEEQKKEILSSAKEKAELYLRDVNKQIESAVKNIRESQADKHVVKEEKKKIEEIKRESKNLFKKDSSVPAEKVLLQIGDYVKIKDTDSVGIIEEFDIAKNKALLSVGSIKMKTKYSDLLPSKKSETDTTKYKSFELDQNDLSYRLDLRGKRADEAEFEIIKFLDSAYMSGADRVEILHGKGTGALKQLVQGLLRNNSSVKNYYFANIEFGGDGITVVELK